MGKGIVHLDRVIDPRPRVDREKLESLKEAKDAPATMPNPRIGRSKEVYYLEAVSGKSVQDQRSCGRA